MVAWLNFEALPSISKVEEVKEVPKPEVLEPEIVDKEESPPTIEQPSNVANVPNRPLFEPLETPEDIPIDIEKQFVTGSGTILGNGNIILTNRHVVEDINYLVVRNKLVKPIEGC